MQGVEVGFVRAVWVAYRRRWTFRQDHSGHRLPLVFNLRIRYSLKFDDKVIRWFCTAHLLLAAVKKSTWRNITKMKLTEEKRYECA